MKIAYYPSAEPDQKGMCMTTAEFRKPRKGEWYISGAIPQGYFAHNDRDDSYYIALPPGWKLVEFPATLELNDASGKHVAGQPKRNGSTYGDLLSAMLQSVRERRLIP